MHQFGQTKVEHLHLPARRQKNVCWLDVAVHNPLGVRCSQRVCHLNSDVEHLVQLNGVTGNTLLQALALQLLHNDEGMAVVLFDAMDGADMRIVQLRSCPRLTLETLQRFGVAHKIFRDELECNTAPELDVFGLIDYAHTTAAQLSQDAIVGDSLADHARPRSLQAAILGRARIPVNRVDAKVKHQSLIDELARGGSMARFAWPCLISFADLHALVVYRFCCCASHLNPRSTTPTTPRPTPYFCCDPL